MSGWREYGERLFRRSQRRRQRAQSRTAQSHPAWLAHRQPGPQRHDRRLRAGHVSSGSTSLFATDWRVFVLALASLGAAFFYTAGSKALGYVALGEVTVFLFMGPAMVCGAYYVLTGTVIWPAVLLSIPDRRAVRGHLACQQHSRYRTRSRRRQEHAGDDTWPRSRSSTEYLVWILASFLAVALTIAVQPSLWPVALVLVTTPERRSPGAARLRGARCPGAQPIASENRGTAPAIRQPHDCGTARSRGAGSHVTDDTTSPRRLCDDRRRHVRRRLLATSACAILSDQFWSASSSPCPPAQKRSMGCALRSSPIPMWVRLPIQPTSRAALRCSIVNGSIWFSWAAITSQNRISTRNRWPRHWPRW